MALNYYFLLKTFKTCIRISGGLQSINSSQNQLTKYSSVNPMSKIDFAPAQTTATGVLPSSVKSALMSNAVKIQFGKL